MDSPASKTGIAPASSPVSDVPTMSLSMTINGQAVGPMDVPEDLMLVELLQEYLNLTGTRLMCGQGVCRACTVLLDDGEISKPMLACITGVAGLQGKKIRTVEAHATTDAAGQVRPSPVQQAFLDHFSFQCSFCTPGFVNAATALVERLQREPVAADKVEHEVVQALDGNLCRCTGYVRYVTAVRELVLATPGLTRGGNPKRQTS